MRIGLIFYGLDRHLTGIGRYTESLLACLSRENIDPILLHAGRRGAPPGSLTLPGCRWLPALLTLGQVQISYMAGRHGLELIHDPTGTMPHTLARAKKVATVHDMVPYIYPQTSSRLDWLIYRWWLPLAAPRLDALITDSHNSKKDILRFMPISSEKVKVSPLSSPSHFKVLPEEEVLEVLARFNISRPYILYVGSIQARKNLARLLEAYAQLRRWSSKWTLVVVGARKWKSSPVYAALERLGMSEAVNFTGFVEDEDLPALYNGADLFVFPSLYEGFGLPVLEAMACGTPVVTSNASSLPEVAGEAALLVDPYNVEEIAAAMRRVLEDPDLAQELREKGLARAKQFSWERTARQTIEVYKKVLREPSQ
jgi:glycosyltransferase involved in cell wall biosynthesis